VSWLFRRWPPQRLDRYFRRLQLVSAAAYSLGHGTNDAQKTMGIIAGVLFTAGILDRFYIPFWVVLMAHAAIGLGTLAGGWRIVKTMGMKITKLKPVGGFCAETAAATSLLGTALAGIPVSTTHTIAGGIMGVGSVTRLSAVRWGVAGRIVQMDGKYVLQDNGSQSTLQLDDQDKAKQFEGQDVKVTGTLDTATHTIHVKDIQAA